jgi:hypothetical protein
MAGVRSEQWAVGEEMERQEVAAVVEVVPPTFLVGVLAVA